MRSSVDKEAERRASFRAMQREKEKQEWEKYIAAKLKVEAAKVAQEAVELDMMD